MKKVLIIILLFFFGCNKDLNKNPSDIDDSITITEEIFFIDEKQILKVPICKKNIDNYLFDEIRNTIKNLKKNYRDCIVNLNYEYELNNEILSYILKYQYTYNNKEYDFLNIYNFDVKDEKVLVIEKEEIVNCLDEINIKLLNKLLFVNAQDISFFDYLIKDNSVDIYIPQIITKKENYTITINGLNYQKKDLEKEENDINEKEKLVAITFDDGPSSKTKEIVDLMNSLDVKVTFFILGRNIKKYGDSLKYIVKNDHEIGNHGFSHIEFTRLSKEEIIKEISKTDDLIYQITKKYPRVFRFPYGSYNEDILNLINYPIIKWNSDSLDWKYYHDELIIRETLGSFKDSGVILFHDFTNYKKSAIIKIINILKKERYRFVTVSELYGLTSEETFIINKIL